MKVKEIIEFLQEFDQEKKVMLEVSQPNSDQFKLVSIEFIGVVGIEIAGREAEVVMLAHATPGEESDGSFSDN